MCWVHRGIAVDAARDVASSATETARKAAAYRTAELRERGRGNERGAGQKGRQQRVTNIETHVVLRSFDAPVSAQVDT